MPVIMPDYRNNIGRVSIAPPSMEFMRVEIVLYEGFFYVIMEDADFINNLNYKYSNLFYLNL